MKESIYIETSVVSYYVSKPSRDLIVLAHQQITWEWWPKAVKRFNAYISEVVVEEAAAGNKESAEKRLKELKGFSHLELTERVEQIAHIYMEKLTIPKKALRDAAHLAVASVHNIDYLVTWNCVHLANGEIIKRLLKLNEKLKIKTPVICTPEELMEG
ncbi:MAG: type II toxin-antitoxin system VapC family toxin [Deltaproteobacteria bacterium]|nr:type II toxin-antitoxin system VapC family toxin [Deltaproteobacteria bacterium]